MQLHLDRLRSKAPGVPSVLQATAALRQHDDDWFAILRYPIQITSKIALGELQPSLAELLQHGVIRQFGFRFGHECEMEYLVQLREPLVHEPLAVSYATRPEYRVIEVAGAPSEETLVRGTVKLSTSRYAAWVEQLRRRKHP